MAESRHRLATEPATIAAPNADQSRAIVRATQHHDCDPVVLRRRFSQLSGLGQVVDLTSAIVAGMTSRTAVSLNLAEDDHSFTDQHQQPNAVDRAIGGLILDAGTILPVHGLFLEAIGKVPAQMPRLERRADLERIDSFQHAAAAVFWRRMQLIRQRQLDPGISDRFDFVAECALPSDRRLMMLLKRSFGHHIHGLRAKDSSGRWAFYHVLVGRDREAAFLETLKSQQSLDLEDFGYVVNSIFSADYQALQRRKVEEEIRAWTDRYDRLGIREREYWIRSGDFSLEWKLAEERKAAAVVPAPLRVSFRRLELQAAAAIVAIASERQLDLLGLNAVTSSLTESDNQSIEAALDTARMTTQREGGSNLAFERAREDVFCNSGTLRSKAFRRRLGLGSSQAPFADEAALRLVLDHCALLDVLLSLLPVQGLVQRFCTALFADDSALADARHALAEQIHVYMRDLTYEQDGLIINPEPLGVALGDNIDARIASLLIERSITQKVLLSFVETHGIIHITRLCYVGKLIETDLSMHVAFVAELLERSLTPVFERLQVSGEERPSIISELTGRLLATGVAVEKGRWVQRVTAPSVPGAVESIARATLPEQAPALWSEPHPPAGSSVEVIAAYKARRAFEKPAGATITDFLKHHYAPWLRSDGQGLTRPLLRRLDLSAYTALANYLRHAKLPPDCPVPNKSEITDQLLSANEGKGLDGPFLRRLGEAARYRLRKGDRTLTKD